MFWLLAARAEDIVLGRVSRMTKVAFSGTGENVSINKVHLRDGASLAVVAEMERHG